MSTGISWRAAALSAGLAVSVLITGCGGGGTSGSTSNPAPESLQTRSYNFNPNTGGQTAVTFTSASAYTFQHENGSVEQGTYQAARDGNTWNVTLSSDTGGEQIYNMTYANESSGTFVLHRSQEPDRTGTFSARDTAIPSGDIGGTPVTPGGGSEGGTVTPSNTYNGFAPTSIAGRVMFGTRTFTSTGPSGQTHTYTFGNGTFHDSDAPEESDGTFVYTAGNSSATLDLTYTAPASFVGDSHHLNMTFTAKDRGNFQSTYQKKDGTEITINGTFEFQPIQ